MKGKSTILGGALLLTAANLFMRLTSIAFNVFLTERIGAGGLGLLQLISTVSVFAIMVGTSGIRVSAMCLAAEEFGRRRRGGVRQAMGICLRWGLAVSAAVGLLLFLAARPIAARLLGDGDAALSLRIMALFLPFACLSGVMTGYFTACSKIRNMVSIKLSEHLFSLLVTFLLLVFWAGDSMERACAAIILGSSLGTVLDFGLLYLLYRRDMGSVMPPKEPLHLRQRLLRLAVPLALNDYLRAGLNTAEQLLIPFGLAKFGGSAGQAMASYGTIHAMVFPILMFPAAILYSVSDLLVPELSRSRTMGRSLRIRDLTDKCLRLTVLFSTAVAGVLFVGARDMGAWIYGSAEAGIYLKLFAPMVLMLYLDAITDGMLKGLAEQISCVRYNTFTSLLDVFFLFLLLPRWGIGGYVFTFVVTHAVNLFLSLRRLLLVSKHKPAAADFLCPLGCGLASVLITLPLQGNAIMRGVFFLLFLGGLFLLTDSLRERDCRWLRGVIRRWRNFRESR